MRWQVAAVDARIVDCQSPHLHAVGKELVTVPVNLLRGETSEEREEVSMNCLLEWRKEWGSISNHPLNILPFVLQAEGEAGICRLGVALGHNSKGLHRRYPFHHHLLQPQLLRAGAPNEATKVLLPPRVVDLKAEAFKSLAGSILILGLANVVRFAGSGK